MQIFKVAVTTVLVICAIIMTALVIRHELFLDRVPDRQSNQVLSDSLWRSVSEHETASGSRTAPVKLVEFYDYECPFCRRFHPVLDSIRAKYREDVSLIYRHFPLDYHTGAYPAAIAVECAGEQGYFEAYHDLLFTTQAQLADSAMNWAALAQTADVPNMDQFQACVAEARTRHRIAADTALARLLGITGTPTLIVNGAVYPGFMSVDELDDIVHKALKDAD